jgi:hypothetical protein
LLFTFKLTDFPLPVTGEIPELGQYLWQFSVDSGTYGIFVKTSALLQTSTPDDPTGTITKTTRAFDLRGNCATFACQHLAWLDGSFDLANETVTVRLPIGASFLPKLQPGVLLDTSAILARLQVASGQASISDLADSISNLPFRAPQRTVALGVADPGADPAQVAYGTPQVVGPDGAFSANLGSVAADKAVFAKACFGNTCSYRSVTV